MPKQVTAEFSKGKLVYQTCNDFNLCAERNLMKLCLRAAFKKGTRSASLWYWIKRHVREICIQRFAYCDSQRVICLPACSQPCVYCQSIWERVDPHVVFGDANGHTTRLRMSRINATAQTRNPTTSIHALY